MLRSASAANIAEPVGITASLNSILPQRSVDITDNYTFDKISGNSETSYAVTPITNVKGLATGSKVRVLGTNNWITTVNYYYDYISIQSP